MHNEKKPRGRPAGREFTHRMPVMMKPETFEQLQHAAAEEGRSAADVVRELIDRWLKRRS